MLIRNTGIYTVGEVVTRGGKLLSIYLIALFVTKEDFGRYSYILSICMVLLVFFDCGINSLVLLRTTRRRFSYLLPYFLITKIIVTVILCFVLVVCELAARPIAEISGWNFLPFLLLTLAWDMQAFTGNALRARLDFIGEMMVKVISNVAFPLAVVVAMIAGTGLHLTSVLWIQATTMLLGSFYGVLALTRGLAQPVSAARHFRRGVLSIVAIGAPMTLAASVGVLHTTIDSLVLGASSYLEINASYTFVQRMAQLSQLPMLIALSAALPYVVEEIKIRGGRPDIHLVRNISAFLTGVGIAVSQVFLLLAQWGIPFLLGRRYDDAGYFGAILEFYIIPLFVFPILFSLLNAMRHVVGVQVLFALSTAINFGADLIVIRLFGPYALAWVGVATTWLLLVGVILFYRTKEGEWPVNWTSVLLAIVGTVAIGAPLLLWDSDSLTGVSYRIALLILTTTWCASFALKRRLEIQQLLVR